MTNQELKRKNQIKPDCKRCSCHETARTVCMRGHNSRDHRPLVVFTDFPDYFADNSGKPYALDTRRILDWMFRRMSVSPGDVALEYTLRCYSPKLSKAKAGRAPAIEACSRYRFATIARLRPKAIAVLGQISLEAFTGKSKVGDHEGTRIRAWEPVVRDHVDEVWVGYSIAYCLISPSDTYRVFRVLYRAAEDAGLNPKLNPNIPPFIWRNLL